jgi:hypothetical protein
MKQCCCRESVHFTYIVLDPDGARRMFHVKITQIQLPLFCQRHNAAAGGLYSTST